MELKKEKKCIDLVQGQFEGRLEDLKVTDPDDENYIEGLCFDYVEPETFDDQLEGYWRWQLSWGGPADEFRIFVCPARFGLTSVHRIEYWYLDWFDGAHVTLDEKLHTDVWAKLQEMVHCG